MCVLASVFLNYPMFNVCELCYPEVPIAIYIYTMSGQNSNSKYVPLNYPKFDVQLLS